MSCGCGTPVPIPTGRKLSPRECRRIATAHRKPPPPKPSNSIRHGRLFYDGPIIRHLAMHVWPTKGSPVWEWNVDQLLSRIEQFNGRRLIGIAVGPSTVPAEAVMDRFKGRNCEFVVRDNKPIGEVVTARETLTSLLKPRCNEIVFYCHAKGVKHRLTAIQPVPVIRWAETMYRTLLDDPPSVNAALVDHTFAGSFRRKFGTADKLWHFSGTFYWLRSQFLPQGATTKMMDRYTGVEFWPHRITDIEDSACLFHDRCDNLYSNGYWERSVKPSLEAWEQQQSTLSVIVPCHNYGRYLGECLASILSQSRQPTEIVVVDDGSTDDTAAVASQFPVKYVRIEARDPHEVRRAGFHATSGKYVCFVDADDRLNAGYLESAMRIMLDKHATIAYSDVQHFGDADSLQRHRGGDIRLVNFIHGGSVCRRDALAASGVMDAPLPDASNRYSDWWLWRNALRCGGEARWHDGLYLYRKHGGSLSDRRQNPSEAYRHCRDLLSPRD